jgi:hypothetical protein
MNGTSGFEEVRSSISRSSTNRLLHEHRAQFGEDPWRLLRTHDLIALSAGISTKREKVSSTATNSLGSYNKGMKLLCFMASVWVL